MSERKSKKKRRKKSRSKSSEKKRKSKGKSDVGEAESKAMSFMNELTELRLSSGVVDTVKDAEEDVIIKKKSSSVGRKRQKSPGIVKNVRFDLGEGVSRVKKRGRKHGSRGRGMDPRISQNRNFQITRPVGMDRAISLPIPGRGIYPIGGKNLISPLTQSRPASNIGEVGNSSSNIDQQEYFSKEIVKIMREYHRLFSMHLKDPNTGLNALNSRLSGFFVRLKDKVTKDLEDELKKSKVKIQHLKNERDKLKLEVSSGGNEKEEISRQQQRIGELNLELKKFDKEHQQTLSDLSSRLTHVKEKNMKYKKILKEQSEEKSEVEENFSKLKEESDRYSHELEEKDKKLEELENVLSKLHTELAESTRRHEEYKNKTKQSRKRLKTSHRQYLRKHEELENQGSELKGEVEKLKSKIKLLQNSNNILKEENDNVSEKNDKLGETNEELLNQNSEIEKKYDELIRKHEEMQGRGKKMGWKHQEIERKNQELILRNEENSRLMKELKNTSESLKETNLEKSRKLASLLEEMNYIKLNSFETMKKLKKESLQSQNQLLKLTDVYSKRTGEYEIKLEAYETSINQLRQENRNLRFQLDKSQKKFIMLSNQIKIFKETQNTTISKNQKLRNKLEFFSNQTNSLKNKIENSNQLWTEKINHLQRLKRILLAEKNSLTEKTQNLSDEVILYHKKLASSQSQEEKLSDLYESKTREAQSLRLENKSMRSEISKFEEKMKLQNQKLSETLNEKKLIESVNSSTSSNFKETIQRNSKETEIWREKYETLNFSYKQNISDNFELKKEHEKLNLDYLKLQREMQQQIISLEEKFKINQNEKSQIQEKYFLLMDELKDEQKKHEELKNLSNLSNSEKNEYIKKIKNLEETINSLIEKKEGLVSENEENRRIISENNKTMNSLRERNQELYQNTIDFQNIVREKSEDIKDLQNDEKKNKMQYKNEVYFRTSQNSKLIQENTRIIEDNRNLRNKIEELNNILKNSISNNSNNDIHLNSEFLNFGKNEKNEYIKLKVENTKLVGSNSQLNEDNENLRKNLDLVKIKYQQQLRESQRVNNRLQKKIKRLKKEIKNNVTPIPQFQRKNILQVSSSSFENDGELDELDGEHNEFEETQRLKLENFELKNEIVQTKEIRNSQILKIKELENTNKELQAKLSNTMKELLEFKISKNLKLENNGELKLSENEIEEHKKMLVQLEHFDLEKESLKQEVLKLQNEIKQLSKQMEMNNNTNTNNFENNSSQNDQAQEKLSIEKEKFEKILLENLELKRILDVEKRQKMNQENVKSTLAELTKLMKQDNNNKEN